MGSEEKLEEKEELQEEASGLEGEEKENQPDPLWKTRGFDSLDAFVANMDGALASEKAARSVAEQALTVKPVVQSPQFDRTKYDEDPEGYSEKFNKEVQGYLDSSKAPQYPQTVLDAAVEGVMVEGEKREINRHVLYGTIRSLVMADPSKKHMTTTPEGLRELGRQALDQFETTTEEKKVEDAPASHTTTKGSPSAASKKGKDKEPDVDAITKKIAEAGEKGEIDSMFDLVLARNAAKLKKEKRSK